jgi:hypothetical protein
MNLFGLTLDKKSMGVQPVERVYRVRVRPVRGVGGMDAVVKLT